MNTTCVHSCKGLCGALTVAERREEEAVAEYRRYAQECDYPDVRLVLERLIGSREEALRTLREARAMLEARFDTLDRLNDSFA